MCQGLPAMAFPQILFFFLRIPPLPFSPFLPPPSPSLPFSPGGKGVHPAISISGAHPQSAPKGHPPLLSNYPISIQAQAPWVRRPLPSVFAGGLHLGEIC